MIQAIITALQKGGIDVSPEEYADLLWLAVQMIGVDIHTNVDPDHLSANQESPNNTPRISQDSTAIKSQQSTSESVYPPQHRTTEQANIPGVGSFPFHVPTAAALPDKLAIGRSLRPLMRRIQSKNATFLNENATVERTAEKWILGRTKNSTPEPVLQFSPRRWLDIILVIDEWPTMGIWRQVVVEFYELLTRLGAFQSVRSCSLVTDSNCHIYEHNCTHVTLHTKLSPTSVLGPQCNPSELINQSEQRVVLIITDCSSPAWYNGSIANLLYRWTTYHMVTIVQMLPEYLWDTSALAYATPVHVSVSEPRLSNHQFKVETPWYWTETKLPDSLPIPIITLEPKALNAWAHLVAGYSKAQVPSFYLPVNPVIFHNEDEDDISELELTPEERWRRFRLNVSPVARELAGYLAAAPLTLPVIRLVQKAMLPQSLQVHLAEVIHGGLIKRQKFDHSTINPDEILYDFVEGVRKLLITTVLRSDTKRVLDLVTDYISQHNAQWRKFRAQILDPTIEGDFVIDTSTLHFATVANLVLRHLGGQYAELASKLEIQILSVSTSKPEEHISPLPENGLGMAVFDNLKAEEEPWLLDVFEAPSEFDLISGPRSAIIFGEPGSGKSAISRALAYVSYTPEGKLKRLLVEWRPRPPKAAAELNSDLVDQQLREIFDACAFAIINYITREPELFQQAPSWAQEVLVWFVRNHLNGDIELRTAPLQREVSEEGYSLLLNVIAWPVRMVLEPDVAPEYIIRELIKAIAEIQLSGIWVLVDDLDIWSETVPELLSTGLAAFLSALALFEQNGFAFKIFLPLLLERFLSGVSGITRRRVVVHYLHWSSSKLTSVVLRRLSFASNREISDLEQICEDKTLRTWLERCGGQTPAGWLEYIRPLIATYLERCGSGLTTPITKAEWLEIRRRHPPKLSVERARRCIRVGERISKELTEQQFALLEYLYDHSGQICTRSELHYLADLKLPYEPVPGDVHWENPRDYSGQLETAIWRLREAVEPDAAHPFFIITVKGKGYRLENAFKLSDRAGSV